MKEKRALTVIALLVCAMTISFGLPKAKYTSQKIVSKLNIPERMDGWRSQDFSEKLNKQDLRYNFVSDIFARLYVNRYREHLLLLILDAGNFHNPKVCFKSSGYTIRDLKDLNLETADGRIFKAHAIYMQKGEEGMLLVYWICIEKKIVDWSEQKLKELWFSLFHKQRAGFMIRLDIPTQPDRIDNALSIARSFTKDLSSKLSDNDAAYLFGQ